MAGVDVERANEAAKAAGVKWPDGKKAFHDWLENNYSLEKENQTFAWLKARAIEFLNEFPKYKG